MLLILALLIVPLVLIGFPMFVALIFPTAISLKIFAPNVPMMIVVQQMHEIIKMSSLLAVPLFIFAADIMSKGTIAERLVGFVDTLLGHIWGGLGITTVGSMTLFGAVCGSSQATVASIGKVMHPKLVEGGYREGFVMALIINSSDIAVLIPPSIAMILYCVVVGASVEELFVAGIGAGSLCCISIMIYVYFWARRNKIPLRRRATFKELWESTKLAKWAFGLPLIIVGGIYGGVFSPTEAAGVSAVYALVVEMFIHRSIRIWDVPEIALSSAKVNAVVFLLMAGAQVLSWFLTSSGIPHSLTAAIMKTGLSKIEFLFVVNALFFLSLMFINPAAVLLILSPLVFPIGMKLGVDPIHLGVIITLQIAIGSATPPFGIDIFTACAVFKRPYGAVVKETPVFIIILITCAILLTLFPSLALFTRNILYGN